jgi:hypothetical protein
MSNDEIIRNLDEAKRSQTSDDISEIIAADKRTILQKVGDALAASHEEHIVHSSKKK